MWRNKYKDEFDKIKDMGYSDEFLRMRGLLFYLLRSGF